MRGFRDRTEIGAVFQLLAEQCAPLPAEAIALGAAAGRVLAADVRSEVAVPAFDRAAMDGYAVRAEETVGASAYKPVELKVVGESLPAKPFVGRVEAGQAVRIMTGAPCPLAPTRYCPPRPPPRRMACCAWPSRSPPIGTSAGVARTLPTEKSFCPLAGCCVRKTSVSSRPSARR